ELVAHHHRDEGVLRLALVASRHHLAAGKHLGSAHGLLHVAWGEREAGAAGCDCVAHFMSLPDYAPARVLEWVAVATPLRNWPSSRHRLIAVLHRHKSNGSILGGHGLPVLESIPDIRLDAVLPDLAGEHGQDVSLIVALNNED